MKTRYYVGGAAAILIAGYLIGRRKSKSTDLAGTGIRGVDYALAMPRLAALATKQVAKAKSRKPLQDFRRAGDNAAFMIAPSSDVQAHYVAAYWLAVASRILREGKLANRAATELAKGTALFAVPGSSLVAGDAEKIVGRAADTISDVADENRQALGVAGALRSMAGQVEGAKERAGDKAWLTAGVAKTAGDVTDLGTKVGHFIRAGIGLEDPRTDEPYPSWQRWLVRGGFAVAGLTVAAIVLRGGVAHRAASAAISAARQRAASMGSAPAPRVTPRALLPASGG